MWPDKNLRWLIILAVTIAWAQSWFDLNLKLVNAQLEPVRFGLLSSVKAIIAVSTATAMLYIGMGVTGVLFRSMASLFISPLLVRKHWHGVSICKHDPQLLKDFFVYGVPMTLTFTLIMVMDVSDRFFLGWFMNAKAVGTYAAVYDLSQQSLGTLMGIVHLAAFPLAVQALEKEGVEGAHNQLEKNALILLAVLIPATVGFVMLAGNINTVVLGSAFREDSEII